MSESFAEMMHHKAVRSYRLELSQELVPIRRAKLVTLIARAKMDAADHSWGATLD